VSEEAEACFAAVFFDMLWRLVAIAFAQPFLSSPELDRPNIPKEASSVNSSNETPETRDVDTFSKDKFINAESSVNFTIYS
jgi:hypothetical protein